MGRISQIGVKKLTPEETGRIICMRPQAIRIGLQQQRFPFRNSSTKAKWKMDLQYNSS